MRTIILAAAALLAAATAASAQTAEESFSYRAPSGVLSEGTTKWNNYRFMFEDAERTAKLRAGQEATGSIGGSTESYPRPGERAPRVRRAR